MSDGAADRYRAVAEEAANACLRCGRKPQDVVLVVAAKTFGVAEIEAVISAGARDIGENYVQEARRKRQSIAERSIRWHLIGRLQRNKAREAVALFDLIHSLDGVDLARALDRAAAAAATTVRCLVEVNLAEEPRKGGVPAVGLGGLLESLSHFSHLRVDGLMAIPPASDAPEGSRTCFRRLRELRDEFDRLRLPNVQLKELSMGMSADFEIAIEEGATLVRIGSAIFGLRAAK